VILSVLKIYMLEQCPVFLRWVHRNSFRLRPQKSETKQSLLINPECIIDKKLTSMKITDFKLW